MKPLVPERLVTEHLVCKRIRATDESELARLGLDPRVSPMLWPFPYPPTSSIGSRSRAPGA